MSNSEFLSEAEKERFYAAFQMFDKDGVGRVSASNLGSMMKSLGKNPTSDELQGKNFLLEINFQFIMGRNNQPYSPAIFYLYFFLQHVIDMINDADLDGNKMLDFEEFLGMMNKKVIFSFA